MAINIIDNIEYEIIPSEQLKYLPLLQDSSNITMEEKILKAECEDIADIQYDPTISETDKLDYGLAIASGLLTSLLDTILIAANKNIKKLNNKGSDIVNDLVLNAAKSDHKFKGKTLEDAIRFLEDKYPISADSVTSKFGGGRQHHLRDFTHHPSLLGLACSIITQFTGQVYGTDTEGNFKSESLKPDAWNKGFTAGMSRKEKGIVIKEKILAGTIIWGWHLVSDMAGSSSTPGAGTGIPGPLLSFFKELSACPIFKDKTLKFNNQEIDIRVFISKLFNGTALKDESGERIRCDFRTELGVNISKSITVLLNESITRACYMFTRLYKELKEHGIKDLGSINLRRILPFGNRTITRMMTVSSLTFTAFGTAAAAAVSAIKSKGDPVAFAANFAIRLNFPGMMQCTIACMADAKYITEDFKLAINQIRENQLQLLSYHEKLSDTMLSDSRRKILYSLLLSKALEDADTTKSFTLKKKKLEWISKWKAFIADQFNVNEGALFTDISIAYGSMTYETSLSDSLTWIYIIALELVLFIPYFPLSNNEKRTSMKYSEGNYLVNFCKHQSIITTSEIRKLQTEYQTNLKHIDSKEIAYEAVHKASDIVSLPINVPVGCITSLTNSGNILLEAKSADTVFLKDSLHLKQECAKLLTVSKAILDKDSTQLPLVCKLEEKLKRTADMLSDEYALQVINKDDKVEKLKAKDQLDINNYMQSTVKRLNQIIDKASKKK